MTIQCCLAGFDRLIGCCVELVSCDPWSNSRISYKITRIHNSEQCGGTVQKAQCENTKRRLLLFSYGNIIRRHLQICYRLYEHTLIINIWII